MTRQEIIDGFHRKYLENIAAETKRRGKVGPASGIPMERVKEIFNESVADYVEGLLANLSRVQ